MVSTKMELEIDEGRVYGARYHTVKPLFTAHAATWFRDEWKELEDWCEQTFGPTGYIWGERVPPQYCHRWYVNDSKFWFREKKDLEWFVLRWS
jgi:hypothetical protein